MEPLHYPRLHQKYQILPQSQLHLTNLPFTQNPTPLDTPTKVNLSKKWKHTSTPSHYFEYPPLPYPPRSTDNHNTNTPPPTLITQMAPSPPPHPQRAKAMKNYHP